MADCCVTFDIQSRGIKSHRLQQQRPPEGYSVGPSQLSRYLHYGYCGSVKSIFSGPKANLFALFLLCMSIFLLKNIVLKVPDLHRCPRSPVKESPDCGHD